MQVSFNSELAYYCPIRRLLSLAVADDELSKDLLFKMVLLLLLLLFITCIALVVGNSSSQINSSLLLSSIIVSNSQRYVSVVHVVGVVAADVAMATHNNSTNDGTRSGRPGPLADVVTSAVLAWIRSSWWPSSTCLAVFLLPCCCCCWWRSRCWYAWSDAGAVM